MSSPDSTMIEDSTAIESENICFSCKGTQSESYLKSGFFKKIIDFQLKKTSNFTIELFGKLFPSTSCMWINMQDLFMEIKRSTFVVKSIAMNTYNLTDGIDESNFVSAENIRMNILKVLHFFLGYIQELSLKASNFTFITQSSSVKNSNLKITLMHLVNEIKHLLLFIGQISNIPGIINITDFSNDTGKSAINFYHYYHLCLDIWYNCLAILYSICFIMPMNFDTSDVLCADFIDHPNPFIQLSFLLIYDLSSIGINRYKLANTKNNSPFICSCISDLWFMLIYFIDKNNSFSQGISFWGTYQSIIQLIVKNSSSLSMNEESSTDTFLIGNIPLHTQHPFEASLWLVSCIAPLYKYNIHGEFCEDKQVKSGYPIAKYLILNLLTNQSEVGERNLRIALSYCLQLVNLWPPSADILLHLTDFFIKKIDETFNIQGNELKALSYLFKDSLTWFTYITNLSNFISVGTDSSFDRFLCILFIQMKLDTDNNLWRSLKGRIYSKFIPKKIKEISEIGLQNSFSLFLTIAASGQFEITGKICELVSLIETTAYPRKQIISWKALFVLIFIYQERKQDMQIIVTLITKFFNSACSDYSKINKDSMHKTNIMNLLLVYIDNINEVFKKSSDLDLSECQLITPMFSDLFSSCGTTEINYILGIFYTILQRILSTTLSHNISSVNDEAQNIRIVQVIFKNVYPVIESISITETAPQIVSDIAATLTKLTYNFSASFISCISYEYHNIFMYFACKENINCNITCRYICLILNSPDLMNELKMRLIDFNILLIQAWLKCTIYMQTNSECIQDLTRKIFQCNIVDFIPGIENLDCNSGDYINISITFYHLIGDSFNNCIQQEKTQIAFKVQQIFKNYISFALNKIKKSKDGASFRHVYKLISHLVEYCSKVLHYHATSEHVLLQLLDKTMYPQILFPRDKALQSLVSCSVKEYLPHLMRGLFKLNYKEDKSVEREIKNLSIYYLSIFSPVKNPLIKLVVDSVTKKPNGLTLDAYEFLLEVLKSSLLSNNVENPVSIFEFYQEVFKLTPPACKKEITNALLKSAMEIYMKQNDSLTDFLKTLIKKILVFFKERMPLSHTKIILTPIIQWFIQEKLQWAIVRGFTVLDTFVEYVPEVIADIVPFLNKSIETLEKNRGLGEDMLIRNGVRNLSIRLQRKFNEK